jgi:hypothetical protein
MEEDACSGFPLKATGVMVHQHKGSSLVGVNICDGDLVMYNKNIINAGDGIYVFAMSNKEYCRLFLFEEISNTVRICAMHTPDIRDVSVLDKIKIPEMENKYKIIGKVLAFLRKNSLF